MDQTKVLSEKSEKYKNEIKDKDLEIIKDLDFCDVSFTSADRK
jgi:hypothetical protein